MGNEITCLGDEIKLFLSEDTYGKFSGVQVQRVKAKLDIIYEDEHIVLVNKPCGMLSQKSAASDVSGGVSDHLPVGGGCVTEESFRDSGLPSATGWTGIQAESLWQASPFVGASADE